MDEDNINEIFVVNSNEIRAFSGTSYSLEGTLLDLQLTPSGQAQIIDFLTNTSALEYVTIINTNASNYALVTYNFNGTDFNRTRSIYGVEGGNGLNCFFGDGLSGCYYISKSGKLFKYNETDTINNTALLDLGNNDCEEYSIPQFLDYDNDDDRDIYVKWGAVCHRLLQLENNGDGTFTIDYNYTTDGSFTSINQVALSNIDGGARELIFTASYSYLSAGGSCGGECSKWFMYNPLTNTKICSVGESLEYSSYDTATARWQSPYLTGLHTCFPDEGYLGCDTDNNGFDEILIVLANQNSSIRSYDDNCNEILNVDIPELTGMPTGGNSRATYDSPIGVWGSLDGDISFDFLGYGASIQKDGDFIYNFANSSIASGTPSLGYFLIADVTGDNLNEVIVQGTSEIYVFSSDAVNSPPTIDSFSWDTGNPVCVFNTINFDVLWTDEESNFVRVAYDCFGNNSLQTTSLTLSEPVEFSCYYATTGNFNMIFYLQDEFNLNYFGSNETRTISSVDTSVCFGTGEGGDDTTTPTGQASAIDVKTTILSSVIGIGFISMASRMFLTLFVVLILNIIIFVLFVQNGIQFSLGALLGLIWFDILMILGATVMGLFPAWAIILLFILGSLSTVIIFFIIAKTQ